MTKPHPPATRTVVVAGASGFIGRHLRRHLVARGDTVRTLVRRTPRRPGEVQWDPDAGHLPPEALEGADVVVNLGGAGLGDRRWSPAYKRQILRSRTQGTRVLAQALTRWPGARLLQASAVGFYGDRGEEELTEDSPGGEGFLAEVVEAWEAATAPAREAGVAVVHLRTGLVLAPAGGAMGRLLPLLRLGLGGPLGSGRQWWPWITLADHVRAQLHLMDSALTGPVNLTAPGTARHGEVVTAVARELRRPAVLRVPGPALRLVIGEFAGDILGSQRVRPRALLADGFTFRHPTLAEAAPWIAGTR